jgi:hypothetical protein
MQFLPCQVMTIMCINVLDCNRQFLLLSLNTKILIRSRGLYVICHNINYKLGSGWIIKMLMSFKFDSLLCKTKIYK